MGYIKGEFGSVADRAWSAAKVKMKGASGEAKATGVGAAAGGVLASTAGAHMGIAAFGTAVAGTALLPVAITVGVGAVAGFAAFKLFKDIKARRLLESEPVSSASTNTEAEPPRKRL